MHIDWFEDFLCLVGTHGFSQAAQQRRISQSALSRRIQALEAWVGVELVDRSAQGVRLTPAGRTFHAMAVDLVGRTQEMRTILKGHAPLALDSVRFAVAHTLSLTYFPGWLKQLKLSFPAILARVLAVNVQDGVAALTSGETDFLITYHHPQLPIIKESRGHPFLELGGDRVLPYSGIGSDGRALFELPGDSRQPFPFLAYESGAYLAYIVELILLSAGRPSFLQRSFETHMAEALKAMIVAGHGIGWLPESCAARELHDGLLLQAGDEHWCAAIDVRIYRSLDNTKPVVERIWQHLSASGSR
ncbi:MAG: transcriptional regulator, LysR family [Proteobacteria bacterium]|nr:transcriptional regulator, LysR family [Pseudomonadota bacterium]